MKEWMERENVYACWLCNFPDISNRQMCKLAESCGSLEGLYFSGRDKWGQVLKEAQVKSLAEYTAGWKPEEEYRRMKEMGISLFRLGQRGYPQALEEIPDPPFGLFVRGSLPEAKGPAVAVIGARDCSEYGRYMAGELGAALGRAGVVVVSGMARGIDGIAQEAALTVGGTSIGVLGSGVDVCYPAQNRELYGKLIAGGAVVSSFPLGAGARPRNFPARNRIVSGLADAVIVVEARAKSGTLITVDTGLEQGREIYAVPGRITDRLSDGCNFLIKQGAGMILSPDEFIQELWELWEKKQERKVGHRSMESSAPESSAEEDLKDEGFEGICGERKQEMQKSLRKYKGGEDKAAAILPELPPELGAIYQVLDSTPKSTADILEALPRQYQNLQLSTGLMKLCMERKAIQVGPGQFCRADG